ncbi:hypothetical protein DIPPA_18930 [Diplonema papillatum]|nr:hypothetical protein DIPPA_18930 [Diplonema papillatum]
MHSLSSSAGGTPLRDGGGGAPVGTPLSEGSGSSGCVDGADLLGEDARTLLRTDLTYGDAAKKTAPWVRAVWQTCPGNAEERGSQVESFEVVPLGIAEMQRLVEAGEGDAVEREHFSKVLRLNDRDSAGEFYETAIECALFPDAAGSRALQWQLVGTLRNTFARLTLPRGFNPGKTAFRLSVRSLACERYCSQLDDVTTDSPPLPTSTRSICISWTRPEPPLPPSGLRLLQIEHDAVLIGWRESMSLRTHNQVTYSVFTRPTACGRSVDWKLACRVRNTAARLQNLSVNTQYRVRIRTESTFGESKLSSALGFSTAVTAPQASRRPRPPPLQWTADQSVKRGKNPQDTASLSTHAMNEEMSIPEEDPVGVRLEGIDDDEYAGSPSYFTTLSSLRRGALPQPDVISPRQYHWPFPAHRVRDAAPPTAGTPFHLLSDESRTAIHASKQAQTLCLPAFSALQPPLPADDPFDVVFVDEPPAKVDAGPLLHDPSARPGKSCVSKPYAPPPGHEDWRSRIPPERSDDELADEEEAEDDPPPPALPGGGQPAAPAAGAAPEKRGAGGKRVQFNFEASDSSSSDSASEQHVDDAPSPVAACAELEHRVAARVSSPAASQDRLLAYLERSVSSSPGLTPTPPLVPSLPLRRQSVRTAADALFDELARISDVPITGPSPRRHPLFSHAAGPPARRGRRFQRASSPSIFSRIKGLDRVSPVPRPASANR